MSASCAFFRCFWFCVAIVCVDSCVRGSVAAIGIDHHVGVAWGTWRGGVAVIVNPPGSVRRNGCIVEGDVILDPPGVAGRAWCLGVVDVIINSADVTKGVWFACTTICDIKCLSGARCGRCVGTGVAFIKLPNDASSAARDDAAVGVIKIPNSARLGGRFTTICDIKCLSGARCGRCVGAGVVFIKLPNDASSAARDDAVVGVIKIPNYARLRGRCGVAVGVIKLPNDARWCWRDGVTVDFINLSWGVGCIEVGGAAVSVGYYIS